MKFLPQPLPFSLVFLGTCCVIACGSSGTDDDDSSAGTGAHPGQGGTESGGGGGAGAGGTSPVGDGGSGTGGRGGSPNPDQKPDPVQDYPCSGESTAHEVNEEGETAEVPSAVVRFSFDEEGNELQRLTDDDGDGTFETGSYSEYDAAGKLATFDYDNDGDTVIDSRAVYAHNTEGDAMSIDFFSPVGTLASYYTLEYDTQRRLVQKNEFRASDDFELRTETYDWVSNWEYDSVLIRGGEFREAARVVLNEYGDVLSREVWQDEKKAIWISKTTTSYDEWGRPVNEEYEDDTVLRVTTSTYGENGLVSERAIQEENRLVQLIKYVYFEKCAD